MYVVSKQELTRICPTPRDAVARLGNRLAMALGAATRAGNALTFTKDEVTVFTLRRLQNKAERTIPRDRFDNVNKVVLDLPFGKAHHLRDAASSQRCNLQ